MPKLSRQLERELLNLGEEAMLLEELDGFVAGLIVCPDLIKPGEWLPVVWGGTDDASSFDSLDHVNRVLGLVMEHYNAVARTLIDWPHRYGPLFAVDRRNNDVLWELWIAGFEKAVALRPEAWKPLLTAETETAQAFAGLLALAEIQRQETRLPKDQIDALSQAAPGTIGPWVVTLNAWRLAHSGTTFVPPFPFAQSTKPGRNDLCPCGSGKKYKKCCGLN